MEKWPNGRKRCIYRQNGKTNLGHPTQTEKISLLEIVFPANLDELVETDPKNLQKPKNK
jgi:hypothetical protein